MFDKGKIIDEIKSLKEEKNAVILAHNYQRGEVQEIADFTGDSLDLSRKAANTDADLIVFCGVRFMAETASILNPDKKVLLPDRFASCELAEMCTVEDLRREMQNHPTASVVSYVNSLAQVKAISDICCTSSNAVDVVRSLKNEEILFLPDRHLASFVAEKVPEKKIIPWDGYCYVHQEINLDKLNCFKQRYPDAVVIVHPECAPEVRKLSDYVGSTAQMQRFVENSEETEYVVGTEDGLTYRLEKDNPNKTFLFCGRNLCRHEEKHFA